MQNYIVPFYLAEQQVSLGRFREAADSLQRSVERKPAAADLSRILLLQGRVYKRLGEHVKAAAVWTKLETEFPDDTDMLSEIAESLAANGDDAAALERYNRLLKLTRDNDARLRFTLAIADINNRIGKANDAVAVLENLLSQLAPDSWIRDIVNSKIETILDGGNDSAKLAAYYRSQLSKRPNDENIVCRLAVALSNSGEREAAHILLVESLKKSPSSVPLRLAFIDLLTIENDTASLQREYELLNQHSPRNVDYITRWGLTALANTANDAETRNDNAARIWQTIVDNSPNDAATLVLVANLFANAEMNENAERLYRRAVELKDGDFGYREQLALFLNSVNKRDDALKTLESVNTNDAATLRQLIVTLNQLGFYDAAMKRLDAARNAAANDVQWNSLLTLELELLHKLGIVAQTADELQVKFEEQTKGGAKILSREWLRLAKLQSEAGNDDAALNTIQRALLIDKDDVSLLREQAALLQRANRIGEALSVYAQLADSVAPSRAEDVKNLAALYYNIGDFDNAIVTARQAVEFGNNTSNVRFYANMLHDVGRVEDAIETLQKFVNDKADDAEAAFDLAAMFANAGKTEHAIEVLWQLYGRTKSLTDKINVATMLADYAMQSQQIDVVIECLKRESANERGAAFCLTQVYILLDDYQSARQTLENLAAGTVNNSTNPNGQDTFLLSKLSRVAELQNDIAAAIRYQEKVCGVLNNNIPTNDSRERDETFDKAAETQRLAVLRNPNAIVTLQTDTVQSNTIPTTSSERGQSQTMPKSQMLNEKFNALFDNENVGSSVEQIDAVSLSSPREERLRDWFFVNLVYESYVRRGVKTVNVQLNERVKLAIDRLKTLYAKDGDLFALSAVMKFYSLNDDAAAVDKKLLSTATDLRVITSIVDSISNDGSQVDDETIRNLLRILRLPTVNNPADDGGIVRRLQERIVLLLERNGKLDSLINGLENQLSSAPQSIVIMNQLLDVYVRSKRTDDAKRVLTKMSAVIGGNTKQMIMFSNRLSQLDMNDEAVTWQLRIYERSPAAFFDNFWQNQNEFRKTKRVDELVGAIKKFPTKVLLDNIGIISAMVSNNLADFDYRTQFVALAESLWNDKRFNIEEQKTVRQQLVRAGLFSSAKEFYPFVHQYVFDMLRNEGSNESPHKVQIWAVDKARSFSLTLLDMMTDEKELQQEIATLIKEFEKVPPEQRNWQHYVDVQVLEILLLMNENETNRAIEKLEQLRNEQKATLNFSAAILGQELSYIDNPKAKTIAAEYLTEAIEACQRENTQGHAIDFLRARLTAVKQ
ncbi:MAG: hypothetical protein LBU65_09400 [Planctomycetaceae bacterium]|nr:hypothetical protein [Planctomycetaceae bacterium]